MSGLSSHIRLSRRPDSGAAGCRGHAARAATWPTGLVFAVVLAVVSACVVAGCASLPPHVERIPSHALPDTAETALARAVAAALPGEGPSGFRVMAAGDVAYSARLALAREAQRSLDLQYYWIGADAPTRTLFAALREAAERGVRVRLLHRRRAAPA